MPAIRLILFAVLAAWLSPAGAFQAQDVPGNSGYGDKQPAKTRYASQGEVTFESKGVIKREKSKLVVCSELASAEEDPGAAVAACSAAVVENPTNGDAYFFRAFAQFSRDAYAEAETDYTRAIDLGAVRIAESYFQRGVCKERSRRLREAAADFKKALELKPDWSAARRKVEEYRWAYE